MMVRQTAIIHDLKQDVEQVRMRFFDFVEQQHAVRALIDCIGQQTALVKTDIARRRTDKAADAVPLHIFGHVETLKRNAEDGGELTRDFGLADARGAAEQIASDGLFGVTQAGTAELDGAGKNLNGLVLSKHNALQVSFKRTEGRLVIAGHLLWRNAGDGGDNRLNLARRDQLTTL